MKPSSFFLIKLCGTRITPNLVNPILFLCISTLFLSCEKESDESLEGLSSLGLHVPEGFEIEQALAPGMVRYPMFATLDNLGRLFVIESSGKTTSTEDVLKNPTFQILLLEDIDGDGIYDKRNVYADKIPYPMGGTFYNGSFYATAAPDLIRFTDTNADGIADKREILLTGWTLSHNAATLSGPFFGPDGWMYMCDARRGFAITTKEGTQLKGKGARIWRCRPDGTDLEWVSGGGFDNTIELIFMPSGETIGTMTYFTDPQDGFRDALMHWVEGGVYPKPFSVIEEDQLKLTGPLMPVMTKLARVSPAGLMRYRSTVFGDEFQGDLFSAQFNTGRIMRHIITPDGGTFRTQEEVFMKSDSADVHPTDVLEDADGSLLVVNTGGWFIAGCPLSVVAKEDIHGNIFRIRKKNASRIKDPWGKDIALKGMSGEALTALLADTRPAVRDQAVEHLVALGEQAVAPLNKILIFSEEEQARTAAVFALYRINSMEAVEGLVSALDDKSATVRTAAARVLGLAKEKKSVDKLVTLLKEDNGSVRRQVATALGQIGDERAIPGLLSIAADSVDRFVEHAIIHSLISLAKPGPIVYSLKDPAENVRKIALIALDQIDGSPLKKSDLIPFLNSKNTALQNTGTWVLSHHHEWSDVVVNYLGNNLKKTELSEAEQKVVTDLLITFSGDGQVRDFVSALLGKSSTPVATKVLLLEVFRQYEGQELPEVWVRQLASILKREQDSNLQSAILDLAQSRSIPSLEKSLEYLILSERNPKSFQLKALSARIMTRPQLSDGEFTILVKCLQPDQDTPVRQSAVRILGQAQLNDKQLLTLAKEEIPRAETFLLPGLVDAFEGSQSEAVGMALVSSLPVSSDRLDYLPIQDLEKLFQTFPPAVQESAKPLMNSLQTRQSARLSELKKFETSLRGGDVGEGRKLFFGKALCSTCHGILGQGGNFGPDLTNIGEIRSQHDLLEAILYPSASFAREYETAKIVTRETSYTGIVKEQLPETIVVETGPAVSVRVSRNEITAIETEDVSLMPPGLHQQLSTAEMSDLLAYLTSLPDGMGYLKVKREE